MGSARDLVWQPRSWLQSEYRHASPLTALLRLPQVLLKHGANPNIMKGFDMNEGASPELRLRSPWLGVLSGDRQRQ